MPRHNESRLQIACFKWFRLQYPKLARILFAIPNGGARNEIEARIMKAEGVTAGVSDCILLMSNNQFSSLCIEFKTDIGRQTDSQKSWQEITEEHGNKYVIVRSIDEFISAIQSYLKS